MRIEIKGARASEFVALASSYRPLTQLTGNWFARFTASLTPRQQQVADLFMDGLGCSAVARKLNVSRTAVYVMRRRLAIKVARAAAGARGEEGANDLGWSLRGAI